MSAWRSPGPVGFPPVRRGWACAGAAVVVLAVAAGCAGAAGDEERASDGTGTEATVSASASPEPLPTAPVIRPSESYPSDQDAVRDVVRLYFSALTEAKLTGDSSQLHEVGSADCVFCNEQIALIDQRREAGERVENGYRIYVTDVKVGPFNEEFQAYPALVTMSVAPEVVMNSDDVEVSVTTSINDTMFAAVRNHDGWRVGEVNQLSESDIENFSTPEMGYR